MKIQIKDIELIYSENQQQFIDEIRVIIQNNYELIFGFLDENRIIDISKEELNFNDMFYNVINEIFNYNNNKKKLSNKDFSLNLYFNMWVRRVQKNNITFIKPNLYISDELLSSLVAYKYFELNGTFDDFVEYLKTKNDEEKIFLWVKSVSRWDIHNYLLSNICESIKKKHNEIFVQMDMVIIWYEQLFHNIQVKSDTNINYPKISEEEFYFLFNEFLVYINAPVEWISIYNKLKEEKLIIFEKEDKHNDKCFVDNDGIIKILICNSENLVGFCNFAHEFIHYVSKQSDWTFERITISELSSIFFQRKAAEFLEKKGYSSEITNHVVNFINSNNYSIFQSKLSYFFHLIRYDKYGEVNRNKLISFYQKIFKNLDIGKILDDDCDDTIEYIIKNGLFVIQGYEYLLDSYLIEQIINKSNNDNMVIEKMIYVANNIGILKIRDILELFNIEDAFKEENIKKLLKE